MPGLIGLRDESTNNSESLKAQLNNNWAGTWRRQEFRWRYVAAIMDKSGFGVTYPHIHIWMLLALLQLRNITLFCYILPQPMPTTNIRKFSRQIREFVWNYFFLRGNLCLDDGIICLQEFLHSHRWWLTENCENCCREFVYEPPLVKHLCPFISQRSSSTNATMTLLGSKHEESSCLGSSLPQETANHC